MAQLCAGTFCSSFWLTNKIDSKAWESKPISLRGSVFMTPVSGVLPPCTGLHFSFPSLQCGVAMSESSQKSCDPARNNISGNYFGQKEKSLLFLTQDFESAMENSLPFPFLGSTGFHLCTASFALCSPTLLLFSTAVNFIDPQGHLGPWAHPQHFCVVC